MPPIAITLGDSCGVGPELLVRAFANGELGHPFLAIGDRTAIELACEKLGLNPGVRILNAPEDALAPDALNLLDAGLLRRDDIRIGQTVPKAGEAAVRYVETATRLALAGEVAAVCTLPINKEASRRHRPDFQGHTELIAGICGVSDYAMMLAGPDLIVTHVSTHVPLRVAVNRVRKDRIEKVIALTQANVAKLRPRCRIAVAGLNPHAGEGGAFGHEEERDIRPAVEWAKARGIDARSPLPPDTLFMRAVAGEFDAVVCMYHDQGHIPMKLYGFAQAVNVTIGLPIVRTSVDHGTAFDIAYQGVASTENLANAFSLPARLSL